MQDDPVLLERVEAPVPLAMLRLNRGVTNPLNLDLIERLLGLLREIREDGRTRGLVLSSANEKFFSIGFDLPAIVSYARPEMAAFFAAYNRLCLDLFAFPGPTVAALRGHAVAGGFILATCCDYRLLAGGHKLMGMNEVKLGVPVPYASACILRELAGYRSAREIMDGGEFVGPDEALRLGLADRVVPQDEVVARAIELAGRLGSQPARAFAITKRLRTGPVEERIRPKLEESERDFLDCWFSDPTQERLRAAAATFHRK